MENEIWKDIKGYDGKYQISNKGNIKNVKRNKLLKIQFNKNYKCIHLVGMDGKIKNYTIHRLMAQSFIPNPDNLPCVNHKDENKLNNSLDNLEWCTEKYNCNYGTRNERFTETKFNNYIKEHPEYAGMSKEDILKERSKRHYYENREKILKKMKEQYVHKSDVHKMTVTHWKEVNGKRVWY